MSPQLHSSIRTGNQSTWLSKSMTRSPPRSPRRPTMGILKNRALPLNDLMSPKSSSDQQQHSLLNEVRESLTMPSCGYGYDDDSQVCDDDTEDGAYLSTTSDSRMRGSSQNVDAITSKSQRQNRGATIKTSRPEAQEQAPEIRSKSLWNSNDADDRSIGAASTRSTKSTRSIRSFFRKRKPSSPTKTAADDVSVAASTKSGWWKRSLTTPEVVAQRVPSKTTKRSAEPASVTPMK